MSSNSPSPSPAPSVVTDITVSHLQPSEVIMHQALLNRDESLASALLMMSAIKIEGDHNRMKRHAVSLIQHIIDTCGLGDHVSFHAYNM